MPLRLSLVSFFVAVAIAACAGDLDNPERFGAVPAEGGAPGPTPISCDPVALLSARCATAGCHSAQDRASGLDLASADVVGRLDGRAAVGGPGVLVVRGAPEQSVLIDKVGETPPFGGRMPFGRPLDAAEVQCLESFIAGP